MSKTTVDQRVPRCVVWVVDVRLPGHHEISRVDTKSHPERPDLNLVSFRVVAQPEKEKDMGSVRQKVRELVGQAPERQMVARGYQPRRIGRFTWEYRNPALTTRLQALHKEAEQGLSDDVETNSMETTEEHVSTPETASEPISVENSLDDQGGQQKWTA